MVCKPSGSITACTEKGPKGMVGGMGGRGTDATPKDEVCTGIKRGGRDVLTSTNRVPTSPNPPRGNQPLLIPHTRITVVLIGPLRLIR